MDDYIMVSVKELIAIRDRLDALIKQVPPARRVDEVVEHMTIGVDPAEVPDRPVFDISQLPLPIPPTGKPFFYSRPTAPPPEAAVLDERRQLVVWETDVVPLSEPKVEFPRTGEPRKLESLMKREMDLVYVNAEIADLEAKQARSLSESCRLMELIGRRSRLERGE